MAVDRNKQSFKLPQNYEILGNLNIACDYTNSSIGLWSKYQLFIYENANFNSNPFTFKSTLPIEKVLMHSNHFLCLDCCGEIHVHRYSPRDVTTTQALREQWSEWKQNVIACEMVGDHCVVCLKFQDNNFMLFKSKFDKEFKVEVAFSLGVPDEDWKIPARGNCLIVTKNIRPEHIKELKTVFEVNSPDLTHCLIVISLDKINIYACLSTLQKEKFTMKKLYKSHTEIIGIKIAVTDIVSLLIGFSSGHFLRIPLTDIGINQEPETIHLNTALYKFTITDNTVLHTDGLTLWKTEKLFSKSDSEYKQFFVRNVRDFCVIEKQIICITFSNLIYSFSINLEESYITPTGSESYCEVNLVSDSEYFKELMDTIRKEDEIGSQIVKENEYFMTLALSIRQDIMDNLIQVTASVFDDYNDLVQENTALMLTDALNEYYDSHSYFFLIKISIATVQHKLNKMLSNLLDDIKIHITLFRHKVLKTTSIEMKEQLKKKYLVIPLKETEITNMNGIELHVSVITNIPAKFDETLRQWIILYRKCIVLNAENFIKTRPVSNSIHLKEDETSLETLIYKRAKHLHGTLYDFNVKREQRYQWLFDVKLPRNYMQILTNEVYYRDHLETKKIEIFVKRKNVGMSKNWLQFEIGDEKVVLSIKNEKLALTPVMTVSCPDMYITSDIRNLLSKIVFSANKECATATEFVNHKLYTDIENLQKEIQSCIEKKASNEAFALLHNKFNTLVYGSLQI